MSVEKHDLVKSPRQIRANMSASAPQYVRKANHYAVHHRPADLPAPGAVLLLDDGMIAVFRGEPDATSIATQAGSLGPVYGLQPSGMPAVPTGRILVRFAAGVQAETHRPEIERAGYELVESLAYAPQAAWLRAKSGDIADALAGIPRLEQLSGVENVEPQMLLESVRRE